jgi:hypothetical protein
MNANMVRSSKILPKYTCRDRLLSLIVVNFVEHPIRFPSKQTSRYDMIPELLEVEWYGLLRSCERYEFGAANTSMVGFCRFGQEDYKSRSKNHQNSRKGMFSNGLDEMQRKASLLRA